MLIISTSWIAYDEDFGYKRVVGCKSRKLIESKILNVE